MKYADLKPCPFCGSKPLKPEEILGGVSIDCSGCEVSVSGPFRRQELMRLWNRCEVRTFGVAR